MAGDLLQTKLYLPSSRPSLVPRPHLIAKLNQGLNGKITLISAPAGFGKTTLFTEFLHNSQVTTHHSQFCWLSLDEDDNDLNRFLTYFVAALQTIEPGIGETAVSLLHAPQPPSIPSVMTTLINELAETESGHHILALDDFHHIENAAIHEAIAFFVENMPMRFHMVIVTRSDPPLPLPRWRVRGQMNELRQADLRFTAVEAAAFLNEMMGLSLTPEQIAALEQRTEGWIAGLQLAALSLRNREDAAGFIQAFSGSHRFVMDYLADEVLQQQDDQTRRFLVETAVLDRLTAPLCDAVTGRNDSHTVLTRLEQANLFIVPLDDARQWYRYHHLFADLLRQRLGNDPDAVAQLHGRAATWYQAAGLITPAVQHAVAAQHMAQAADLIEAHALEKLNQSEIGTIIGWLDRLPANLVRSRPWLSIARAWSSLLTGQVTQVQSALQDAAQSDVEVAVQGHIAAIQAYAALMMGDVTSAAELARQALTLLPEEDASTRSVVTFTLGGASFVMEDVDGAITAFTEAGTTGKAAGNLHLAISALSALGTMQVHQGKLHRAMATFAEAYRLATGKRGQVLPVATGALNGKGRVLYEWGDLAAAASHLETAVQHAQVWGNVDSFINGQMMLAQVYMAQGETVKAQAVLPETDQFIEGKRLSPGTDSVLIARQMDFWLAQGKLAQVRRCVQERGLTVQDALPLLREVEYLAFARFLITEQAWVDAKDLLERLLVPAESGGRTGSVIKILALRAVVFQAMGDEAAAMTAVSRALSLAEPEGFVRSFVDAGPPMADLLARAVKNDISADYAARLLSAFPQHPSPPMPASAPDFVEPLNEQELKILRLVAAGLSNKDTAVELYLSVNTVKWHLKNIYGKLYVNNRVTAVARAQELDLI